MFIRTGDDLDTCEAVTATEVICDPLELVQHFVVQFCIYLHTAPFEVKGTGRTAEKCIRVSWVTRIYRPVNTGNGFDRHVNKYS